MQTRIVDSLDSVPCAQWNRLLGPDPNPFLTHEFLAALERHGCVGEHWGWAPRHLLAYRGAALVGAAPLYLKTNSYGELVFDWGWADAYRRAGLRYYPKLVAGVPYTPATGARLLVAPGEDGTAVRSALLRRAGELARELEVSSLHWLFTDELDSGFLAQHGLHLRSACQFHWHNRGYRDFDDFLDRFTAAKRKKLKRERRRVADAGVELRVPHGDAVSEAQWAAFHRFYVDTFDRLGGYATLTESFFHDIAARLGARLVLVLAYHQGRAVAGALSLRGGGVLYGRHWGCEAQFDGLHFEACYYSGIDYCIRHGLQHFQPGAQGEHKVARGFEPALTRSAHWLAHPDFDRAVSRYVCEEHALVSDYMQEMSAHLPFKHECSDA